MGGVWSEIGYKIIYIPIGPWEDECEFSGRIRGNAHLTLNSVTEKQRYVAELMRQDSYHISNSFKPLLLNQGFFSETVDKLIAQVHNELKNLDQKLYVKVSLQGETH